MHKNYNILSEVNVRKTNRKNTHIHTEEDKHRDRTKNKTQNSAYSPAVVISSPAHPLQVPFNKINDDNFMELQKMRRYGYAKRMEMRRSKTIRNIIKHH